MQMNFLNTRTMPNEVAIVAKHKNNANELAKHKNNANESAKHKNNGRRR